MHRATLPPRRASLSANSIVAVVVLSTAGYCYACPPPEPPPTTRVAAIYVLPSQVWAAPDSKFAVRARLVDNTGNVLPDADAADLQWSLGSGLALDATSPTRGPNVIIKTPPTGGVSPFHLTSSLTAQLESWEPVTIPIYVTDGSAPNEIDWVAAKYQDFAPPSLALVDGNTSSAVNDMLTGFVGKGPLDYFTCPASVPKCGEVTLFSNLQGLYRLSDVDWTTACEGADFSGNNAVPPPVGCRASAPTAPALRRVPLDAVYILTPGGASTSPSAAASSIGPPTTDVMGTVKADLTLAQLRFAEGWAGLTLSPTIVDRSILGNPVQIVLASTADNWCTGSDPTVRQQLIEGGLAESEIPGGKKITVAYVGKLMYSDGVTEVTWAHGLACPWNARVGTIVLVSWNQWQPTTLPHELIHAIGPWQAPPWGHTSLIDGLNESNIMWTYEDDSKPVPRSLLTLGQAFRMSLDIGSIFYRGDVAPVVGTFSCQFFLTTDLPDTPCPRITRDVTHP